MMHSLAAVLYDALAAVLYDALATVLYDVQATATVFCIYFSKEPMHRNTIPGT